jgi:hypothetical protein
MSEVNLNLIDAERILHGPIHGSVADACVAALTAEPETIAELEISLARYIKPLRGDVNHFGSFVASSHVDINPWDAGIVIIDLAARVVAAESTYSQPGHEGTVDYHDGTQATDVPILYRVSDEWRFLNSIAEYEALRFARIPPRPPLDTRQILYGRPLLMHILTELRQSQICAEGYSILKELEQAGTADGGSESLTLNEEAIKPLIAEVSAIHARWLMTPLAELDGQSPRDVLLAKRELVDFDLHTREMQWTFLGEGPPCLSPRSAAYRFGGFGTHECVIYYDLVRFLIWTTIEREIVGKMNVPFDIEAGIKRLERIKNDWLENPQEDFEGRIPAIIIDNERRRLPNTLTAQDMIIDDNCEMCLMSARAVEMGEGPGFWHLDGSNMDDEFAFSFHRTRKEWEEEIQEREEFNKEFNRKWKEREERLARGEAVDDDLSSWFNSADDETEVPSPSPQSRDQIH